MKRSWIITIAIASLLAAALPAAAAADKGPSIRFGPQSIQASGFRPGATVVVFAVVIEPTPTESIVHRWCRAIDDSDGDGAVTYDLGRSLPVESICAAIDTGNGDYAIASPPGAVVDVMKPSHGWFHKRGAATDVFSFNGLRTAMIYVHPGQGVWLWMANDGTPSDSDGPNGVTTLSVDQAVPLKTGDGKPKEFVPGGILVAVDWVHMSVLATRLDGAMLRGAQ